MSEASHGAWQWLGFPADAVRSLLAHARATQEHDPTPDQMLERRHLREDAPRPPRGVLPPRAHVALDTVPAGLLVRVRPGLGLASNGLGTPAPATVYAAGCDPEADADWAARVEALAGAEAQVLFLPAEAVAEVLDEAGAQVWLGLCRDDERFAVEEYALAATPGEAIGE